MKRRAYTAVALLVLGFSLGAVTDASAASQPVPAIEQQVVAPEHPNGTFHTHTSYAPNGNICQESWTPSGNGETWCRQWWWTGTGWWYGWGLVARW